MSNNNPWIPGHRIKEEWCLMKSNIGDFGQNYGNSILPYIKCEFKYHQQLSSIYSSLTRLELGICMHSSFVCSHTLIII